MAIVIGALEFDGPFYDFDSLSDEPGIYAVLGQSGEDFELIEMSDAEHVRETLQLHDDRESWYELGSEIAVAVHYTADLTPRERAEIKEQLEREFDVEDIAA